MLRLRFAAALMLLCLVSSAQPDDPNQGRRPAPRVPLTGVGWLVAAGALVGGLALRRTGIQLNSSRRHQGAKSRLRIFILVCATGQAAYAQECVSVSDGDWDVPSTWANGVVPTSGNSTSVKIHHTVTIAPGSDVSVDNLVVEDGRLVVLQGGVLQLVNGDSTDLQLIGAGALEVWGTVIGHDGISLEGLRAANTIFREGSTYEHRASGEGSIPLAQWHPQSRFVITGISGNVSMRSEAWRQPWGTVVYQCPAQGEFVEFRGMLETIQGDFIIASTRNAILRLSQSQTMQLTVGGDLVISGPSEVWFSQSGTCTVDVAGDFVFASTSGASSYFTTTGVANVTIGGDLVVDAEHRLRMASGSGTGRTELTLRGDATFLSGRIDAAGTGSGTVIFGGSDIQHLYIERDTAAGFDGHVNFIIAGGADVDLGTSLLSNTAGGDLLVEGTLRIGSLNEEGAIQAGAGGNVQVEGVIAFGPDSRLIFNGNGPQYLSYSSLGTQVEVLSPRAVVLSDIQFGTLNTGASEFNAGPYTISVQGDLQGDGPLTLAALVMNGSAEQSIDVTDVTVHDLVVRQASPGSVVIQAPLRLTGMLSIDSPGTQVISNGNLVLVSSSESPEGTASIGRLAGGSTVVGDVVVQRFIAGAPGDRYRYISSPVRDASVADLMDDVPVTGTFDDADYGGALPKDAPSLFYYSEEVSDWIPFPVTGTSQESRFESGRGYCFFNWNGQTDTNWDVAGTVHQGTLTLPVTYAASGDTTMRGWNLVGNPYPSTIQWGPSGWDSHRVSAAIAVRDNLNGGFRYWDGEVGSLTDGLLASGQSFWVRTTGEDPYLIITEDAKATIGGEYYRERPPDFLELSLRVGSHMDRAYLRIREGALHGLDTYDAPKMQNDSLSLAFRTAEGVSAAIHAVSTLECEEYIPLDIHGDVGRTLTFRIQGYGALQRASFAVFDEETGMRYDFDAQGEVTLGGSPGLQLHLIVESEVPTSLAAAYPDRVCPGDTLYVVLGSISEGVQYYLETDGYAISPIDAHAYGSTLLFAADSLVVGENRYELVASSACAPRVVVDTLVISRGDSTATAANDCNPEQLVVGVTNEAHADKRRETIVAFPIPTTETLFLTGSGINDEESVQIYSADGRFVKNVRGVRDKGGCLVVELSGLAAGYYYILVAGKKLHGKIRILKMN